MPLLKSAKVINSGGGLNMRCEPAVRAWNVLGQLPDGASVTLLDPLPINSEGRLWYYVDSAFGPGFVAADYLKLNGSANGAAPVGDVLYAGLNV